jgi:two-component system phosphate regulon sensor histidine kinase PhoR
MSRPDLQQPPSIQDLDLLAEISQMLTLLDRDRLLERVIELTVRALGAEKASLLLHPDHTDEWNQVFIKHTNGSRSVQRYDGAQSLHFARRVLDRGLAGWVVQQKQGTIVYDTEQDDRWYVFPDSKSGARSAICVPFLYDDSVLGVLTLLHSEPHHFTETHLRLMTIIANQTTVAVRNTHLFNTMLRQQRQLEAILHAMPDLLLVLDEDGRILLSNEAAAHFLETNATQDSVVGRELKEFLNNDSFLSTIYEIVDNPLQSGQTWSFEARAEQQRRDYLVTISVWENAEELVSSTPAPAGYVVVMRDITTLRDLNRFKDEMLQMASHDLRSPLALIVGYCSLIALEAPEGSQVHEYLDIIQRSTERMKGLLDDLLRVEQIRNSPLELHEQVDILELANTVLNNMRPLVDSKNQSLEARLALDNLPGVVVNPILIREAMENLISNAVKYTPEGGHIQVQSYVQAGRLHYIVEDNGIGIPRQALPRLFESFYRVKQEGTENIEGRGLGLSLVKTIIERHNGEVWVESEVGVGSRFGFWVPI